jgi:uncharacterized membrane protein YcgQ (UPF0703/DUF1980 family)
VIDTFCFVKKEEYNSLVNYYEEMKKKEEEERKRREEEKKRMQEEEKKKLQIKVEEIVQKFKDISDKINTVVEYYEGYAYITTQLLGFVPKDQFNKYLALNKELGGKYDPKNQKWKIEVK